MPIHYTYLCVAVALLAALVADCGAYKRQLAAGAGVDKAESSTDAVLMLSPFLVFFYPEAFWLNFAGFMALWALGCIALYGLHKLRFVDHSLEMQKVMGPGITLLVGIGYLIFLHEGPLANVLDTPINELAAAGVPILSQGALGFPVWVWWAYGFIISLSLLIARHKDGTMIGALGLLLGLAILPFYTPHYWWSLGAGVIVFLLSLKPLLYAMDETSKGGIGFVLVFLAQMLFVGSIVVYAIFF